MSEATPVRGVVLCHGDMARGLVEAVQHITGLERDALVPVSNRGLAPDEMGARVRQALGDGPAIVFTDLQAGSCGFAARKLCFGRKDLYVISGVNLPLLVDFAMHRETALSELVPRLLETGRRGITATEPVPEGSNDGRAVSRG